MKKILYCFPEGKHKVLTMSYDDGRLEDRKLVHIFNKYGIKGTFHINSGKLGEEDRIGAEEIKTLYKGHEISVHTLTHPTIARCPKEQIIYEILEDRKNLENIVGYTVRGMSYPNGSYDKDIIEVLPHLGIEYSRIVGSSHKFDLPEDFHKWMATCHHNHDLLKLGQEFVNLNKKQYLYMMYVWGHSYEFTNDNNWEFIEKFCENMANKKDIWYATNMEIVDYLTAIKNIKFSVSGNLAYNTYYKSLWISVDDRLVELYPGNNFI